MLNKTKNGKVSNMENFEQALQTTTNTQTHRETK